jgi:hypothetical protein
MTQRFFEAPSPPVGAVANARLMALLGNSMGNSDTSASGSPFAPHQAEATTLGLRIITSPYNNTPGSWREPLRHLPLQPCPSRLKQESHASLRQPRCVKMHDQFRHA